MIREVVIAAALTAGTAAGIGVAAIGGAAPSAAEPGGHYDTDVPGMNDQASLGAPCHSWERFIFGRGPGGETLACHWIPNQGPPWDPPTTGFWVASPPIRGVQEVGAPCPDPARSQVSAQSPDGLPMLCTERGWQPGWFTGGAGPYAPPGFHQP
ncbi:hypothetical protein H7J77_18390 [Mycolicibacillus parakoreensis]|uniref:Secreted protein n=1 Tax=Mycolicibacillus parakoreensis TaxID=1069221 RepID=A0ABY3U2P7_9MYCO|nr:hypothetical protein [Mycolicibacillus parakoreensis]MCV7317502.1 hypothetical protein [Mycolicibacillus parakoreensis]ULN54219.1 hypothetical protein MIU77_08160 [Mycolicibacillus parakoreensis]